jgi:integrase
MLFVADIKNRHRRQWRDYRTAAGGRPVKDFLAGLTDEEAAATSRCPPSSGTALRSDKNSASRGSGGRGETQSTSWASVSPYVLRHRAIHLLHAGIDPAVIALWLGHESGETTQIYRHADLAMKERALALTAVLATSARRARRVFQDTPGAVEDALRERRS